MDIMLKEFAAGREGPFDVSGSLIGKVPRLPDGELVISADWKRVQLWAAEQGFALCGADYRTDRWTFK